MAFTVLVFAVSAGGILLLARFALFKPAQRLASAAGASSSMTGQFLGYLTSAPELVATLFISGTGLFTVVAVNILGSNVINVLLAVAAAFWFKQARRLAAGAYRTEHLLIALSIVVPVALLLTGNASALWTVPLFLVAFVAYLRIMKRIEAPQPSQAGEQELADFDLPSRRIALNIGILILGIAGLYFLGDLLGESVRQLGTSFGVSAIVLGVAVAVTTSLPELTTFFSSFAAHRKAGTDGSREVIHNVLASNISNLLIIQTVGVVGFHIFA